MSVSRAQFLQDLEGIAEAVKLGAVGAGDTGTRVAPGILMLRRGILVGALVALETFVRDRTTELLQQLGRWPARFEDLPTKFREASLLDALSNLQRYALMLKRQEEENWESELMDQIKKMSSNRGPAYEFTKFIAGDYTGNISSELFKRILSIFQVKYCWNSFRLFSSEIGLGVPSVENLIKEVVRNRHRSAHTAIYVPTADDISSLFPKLFCLGVCFDVAMTASIEQALAHWKDWAEGKCNWRDATDLYFVDHHEDGCRLKRSGRQRALRRIADGDVDCTSRLVPRAAPGRIAVVVTRDSAQRPMTWRIL